jgi:hypothetical protein
MNYNSIQEEFWATKYAEKYIEKNNFFDQTLSSQGWQKMLADIQHDNAN